MLAVQKAADAGLSQDPVAMATGYLKAVRNGRAGKPAGLMTREERTIAGLSHADADPDFESGLDKYTPKTFREGARLGALGYQVGDIYADFEN